MYIKRVIIRGFKTYKNETIIEDFSPHHNVVVGRNGSGKSNFFAAIRFVLSDAYTNLSREERQALIHESSVNIMSAFVEIVFDNTDRRIPIAKDEIAIRRTIGMKKDDYSLDYKSATKSDIMNLLEASGFSKSNPYYIVPQGKVTALTNAKDSERLELLKDIAGARVFENKLKESLKEMAITDQKQQQIKEMISDIEKRLDELNVEKEDLKNYDKLTTRKKMLEFNIYDRELKALSDQIDAIEDKYSISAQETDSLVNELEERENEIAHLETELNDLNNNKRMREIDLQISMKEKFDILQQISSIKIQIQEAKIKSKSLYSIESYGEKIRSLKEEIKVKSELIESETAELKELKNNEHDLKSEIASLKQTQLSIISKKTQSFNFRSSKERDAHIRKEISDLVASRDKKSDLLASLQQQLESVEAKINDSRANKRKLQQQSKEDEDINKLNSQILDLKHEARDLVDERSLLWRKESKLNSVIVAKLENLQNSEQSLRSGIESSTLNALERVKEIAKSLGPSIENGVYGYLGELIDVSEKYKTAVDVIGGNSLFHIVVNNDQTASILIEELKKEKRCRTTFIPLNRLQNEDFTFPTGNTSVPLIKKIAFDEFLAPAVKQIFGKTVVCVDIRKGYELADKYQVNAVTLDGDRCDNRGVLTGGFRDTKVSRIDYLKNMRTLKSEIFDLKNELQSVKTEINEKDFAINANYQKTQSLKVSLDEKLNERNEVNLQISKIENNLTSYRQDTILFEEKINTLNASIQLQSQKIDALENELKTPFSQNTFSENDETVLQDIHDKLPLLEKKHHEMIGKIDQLELHISSLRTMISDVLTPRFNQLQSEIEESGDLAHESEYQLEDLESRLNKLMERNAELEELEKAFSDEQSKILEGIETRQQRIEDLKAAQESFIKQFEDYGKSTDKNLAQRMRLKNRKHELERNIGELGILPEDTLIAFANDSTVSLSQKLTKVNESLKKFNYVNKKALEQFSKFAKQRDTMVERISELDEAKFSIDHLIVVLQDRKNEAIIRAFKEVSVSFAKIFEQLVPAGKGRLIIQKKNEDQQKDPISLSQYPDSSNKNQSDDESSDEEGDDFNETTKSIDSFIGISISVSFNSKKNEQQRLEQLSGGQKALCALSLILAIQSCDPAPFYLFDEIDSNLDAQYRAAVANLINKLSRSAQFICTTFRPEMLKVSDRFYGVMFNNKVSTISNIDAERALDFVENQTHI
ncbi:hypothetical protein CANINC_000502 [Pichia inconspicua]|uniref:Structural maintenance of chromosomes protein n=1 Tax=Pichia inconspicua TaxID=52247 RepID=A0A4V4NG77_9ASCO|nr:hypothetical protein CANINC_000502 [[Candida] inconspicua]